MPASAASALARRESPGNACTTTWFEGHVHAPAGRSRSDFVAAEVLSARLAESSWATLRLTSLGSAPAARTLGARLASVMAMFSVLPSLPSHAPAYESPEALRSCAAHAARPLGPGRAAPWPGRR